MTPWWRAEFGSRGELLSCVRCKDASQSTAVIVYTQGACEADARAKAARIRDRIAKRERQKRYMQEGRCCECGDPKQNASDRMCPRCRSRQVHYNTRRDQREKGLPVVALNKSQAIEQTRRDRERMVELRVLMEVLAAYYDSKGVSSFEQYLVARIASAERPLEQKAVA